MFQVLTLRAGSSRINGENRGKNFRRSCPTHTALQDDQGQFDHIGWKCLCCPSLNKDWLQQPLAEVM